MKRPFRLMLLCPNPARLVRVTPQWAGDVLATDRGEAVMARFP
ncbi:hypothetical protein [Pelagovum pacificum]|nr:hypothetical protein [Pelagovum pacificum]